MTETAIFAGGCFWCMVKPFDQQPGIKSVISGYTGVPSLIRRMNKLPATRLGILKRLKSLLTQM